MKTIFVYGTLMRGMHNHRWMSLAGGKYRGEREIFGRLYCIHSQGKYSIPAAALVGGPPKGSRIGREARITGEIYDVPKKNLWVLDLLENGYTKATTHTTRGEKVFVYVIQELLGTEDIGMGSWREFVEGYEGEIQGG